VRIVSVNQFGQDQFAVDINNGNWALVDNDFSWQRRDRGQP